MIRINNTQYSHFLQQADILRRSGSLCDAVISVDSQTFRAHRLVLACVSKTLAQRLTQGGAVGPLHCTLELFSSRTFQQVLDFAYTQALEVPVDDLCPLLRAARLLEMQSLEEQCRMRLDSLDRGTAEARGESGGTEREQMALREATTEERGEGQRGSPVMEEDLRRSTSLAKEAGGDPVTEALPQPDTAGGCTRPLPPRKRLKMPPVSATLCARDSVITSPATSHSSPSPPSPPSPSWVSPRNKWHPVNALRRIAQNYSSLLAAQSLQPSQSVVAYPFPLCAPHMYPLLASSLPSQVHGSVIGYPGNLHPYKQHFFTRSPELGDILKQGLPDKKNLSHGQRRPEERGPRTQRVKDCHHCSTRLLGSPWLQESTSTPSGSGEACAGHRLCGRGYGVEGPTLRSHPQGHAAEKPYECKRCAKRFNLKHQLDTHLRVHTGEKPFECRLCGRRSRDYSAMIKHLRTHGGATPYQCTVCLEYCSSLAAMQKHLKSHPLQDFPSDWTISNTYLYTAHLKLPHV